jgi:hypothetical protein
MQGSVLCRSFLRRYLTRPEPYQLRCIEELTGPTALPAIGPTPATNTEQPPRDRLKNRFCHLFCAIRLPATCLSAPGRAFPRGPGEPFGGLDMQEITEPDLLSKPSRPDPD